MYLVAQNFADVAQPELMQRFEQGVFLARARDVVETELAALVGGKRFGLESLFAGEPLLFAFAPAGGAGVGGGRRGWAEKERTLLDFFGEDAFGFVGVERAREEDGGDGLGFGGRLGLHCVGGVRAFLGRDVLVRRGLGSMSRSGIGCRKGKMTEM